MHKFGIVYFSVTLLMVQCKLWCSEPVIQMGKSNMTGQKISFGARDVKQFLGIRYAEPPTGQFRFKKPQPVKRYASELFAFNSPPACIQYVEHPIPLDVNSTQSSEDCLFLNIWTPCDASPANRKAVLYWVHGGGFRYGSISHPFFSGIPLAALGDIIVVTINYRLGAFGFLTSGTQDAPGNAGLWDILEGLRWVHKYIGYFGGDTSRITIAGQSAGSMSVGLLSVSPLAKGLYKRQIMESGSPTYLDAENNTQNLAFSQRVAETVGCATPMLTVKEYPKKVLDCLRGVETADLAMADNSLDPLGSPTFFPQYGDKILPENARISIMKGKFRCSELLIGNTKDEGSFLLTMPHRGIFGCYGEKYSLINKSVGADLIREAFKNFPDPELIARYYLPDSLPENAGASIRHQTYTSLGDRLILCPSVYHAEKCSDIGGKVYYYFFTHRLSSAPWAPWVGVRHVSEIPFVFGSPLLHPSNFTQSEQEFSEQIIEIWSSFVKYGNPSIPWPRYSKEEHLIKIIGPEVITGENGIGPHQNSCGFLRPFFTSV